MHRHLKFLVGLLTLLMCSTTSTFGQGRFTFRNNTSGSVVLAVGGLFGGGGSNSNTNSIRSPQTVIKGFYGLNPGESTTLNFPITCICVQRCADGYFYQFNGAVTTVQGTNPTIARDTIVAVAYKLTQAYKATFKAVIVFQLYHFEGSDFTLTE